MEEKLFSQIKEELTQNILPYWPKYAKDLKNGGFFGAIANDNTPNAQEWRGIVMVSRFLWTYSAAARLLHDASLLDMADYAHSYMMKDFYDPYNGGMYWSVQADGIPLVNRKQVYGDAFAIYALSEYAAAVKELRGQDNPSRQIMGQALSIYQLLEQFALDKVAGGYLEALAADWTFTTETKLSPKDIDCDKSMNTNLHVMEAYTNLYRTLPLVCPELKDTRRELGASLELLVRTHVEKILNPKDYHLDLYFNKDWSRTGRDEISYGHDIEASWLLWEAAGELGNKALMQELQPVALKIAEVALAEGFDEETGGFENCMDEDGRKDTTRIWWNQAEALNGFYNAWEMTGSTAYEAAVYKVWHWIKEKQADKTDGEWYWAVSKDGTPHLDEDKGGNWKTSYHNARCCMELLRRRGEFQKR